jgi:uncharacterized protein (TIGR03790 family)
VIHIRTAVEERIERAAYLNSIEVPVSDALAARFLQDRVLYIVLTKGVPLTIVGDSGPQGTVASVDSELTLAYRHMTGVSTPERGRVANPYYFPDKATGEAKPFTHRDFDTYLVTRLDGFTVDDVIALIDRGSAPAATGEIVLDQQDKPVNRMADGWLEEAASRLTTAGHGDHVLIERTAKGVRDVKPVLGYYSWGSNDPGNRTRRFNLGFVPGAIAGMFLSSDARTFKEPPDGWVPTDGTVRSTWFAGTSQSLTGDLIREGVTGVSGHVDEPYMENTVRPEVLFPAYLSGLNLAEAFYLAMPSLSWQNVVIGDPLCSPFRKLILAKDDADPAVDERTGLPKFFSARRVDTLKLQMPGVPDAVVQLAVRGATLLTRGDRAGARLALEEAARLAPQQGFVQLQLALVDQAEHNVLPALERYRQVIALQPRNGIALNNLAYTLAVEQNEPAAALPFAQRALSALPQNADVLDTMAWIEHLLGRHDAAARRIADAVRSAPGSALFRLHAAIINAAAGAGALAKRELQAALTLQPSLDGTPDVTQLRARLQDLAASP